MNHVYQFVTIYGQGKGSAVNIIHNDVEKNVDLKPGQTSVDILLIANSGYEACNIKVDYNSLLDKWYIGFAQHGQSAFPSWPLSILSCPWSANSVMIRYETPTGLIVKVLQGGSHE